MAIGLTVPSSHLTQLLAAVAHDDGAVVLGILELTGNRGLQLTTAAGSWRPAAAVCSGLAAAGGGSGNSERPPAVATVARTYVRDACTDGPS